MDIVFLGTGAGIPSKHRNVTSMVLRLYHENGSIWMFDCGEGTQHQILHTTVKLGKINKLFVTHMHGDHLFGIPGFLSSRSFQSKSPLCIYGPPGIVDFINTVRRTSQLHLNYPLKVIELKEGKLFEDEHFVVKTARLEHGIESFGFRIEEKPRQGRLDVKQLKKMGVLPGPRYGMLKKGQMVRLADGRILNGKDFIGPPQRGRTIVLIGDTQYCDAAVQLADHADVLVHESTFSVREAELAQRYHHATTAEAAEVATRAGVSQLILTHISARYAEHEDILLEEARRIFPKTDLARDFLSFEIPFSER